MPPGFDDRQPDPYATIEAVSSRARLLEEWRQGKELADRPSMSSLRSRAASSIASASENTKRWSMWTTGSTLHDVDVHDYRNDKLNIDTSRSQAAVDDEAFTEDVTSASSIRSSSHWSSPFSPDAPASMMRQVISPFPNGDAIEEDDDNQAADAALDGAISQTMLALQSANRLLLSTMEDRAQMARLRALESALDVKMHEKEEQLLIQVEKTRGMMESMNRVNGELDELLAQDPRTLGRPKMAGMGRRTSSNSGWDVGSSSRTVSQAQIKLDELDEGYSSKPFGIVEAPKDAGVTVGKAAARRLEKMLGSSTSSRHERIRSQQGIPPPRTDAKSALASVSAAAAAREAAVKSTKDALEAAATSSTSDSSAKPKDSGSISRAKSPAPSIGTPEPGSSSFSVLSFLSGSTPATTSPPRAARPAGSRHTRSPTAILSPPSLASLTSKDYFGSVTVENPSRDVASTAAESSSPSRSLVPPSNSASPATVASPSSFAAPHRAQSPSLLSPPTTPNQLSRPGLKVHHRRSNLSAPSVSLSFDALPVSSPSADATTQDQTEKVSTEAVVQQQQQQPRSLKSRPSLTTLKRPPAITEGLPIVNTSEETIDDFTTTVGSFIAPATTQDTSSGWRSHLGGWLTGSSTTSSSTTTAAVLND